jgi:hypothetical protein
MAVERSSMRSFFSSPAFLTALFVLLALAITVAFVYMMHTPVARMNEPTPEFTVSKMKAASVDNGKVPYSQPQAILHQ